MIFHNHRKLFSVLIWTLLMITLIPVYGYGTLYISDIDNIPYTDGLTGTTYTVPAGWESAEFNSQKEFFSAKYRKDDAIIMFGSMDIWEMLDESAKSGYTRETFNNSVLSDDDWAAISGLGNDDLSIYKETYSGEEYVMIDSFNNISVGGYSINTRSYSAYVIKNGYMIGYTLQIVEDTDNPDYFKDFEYILNSASYRTAVSHKNTNTEQTPEPAAETPAAVTSAPSIKRSTAEDNGTAIGIMSILVFVFIILIILTIAGASQKSKASEVSKIPKNTPESIRVSEIKAGSSICSTDVNDRPSSVSVTNKNKVTAKFCPHCGNAVSYEYEFCKYCGSKLAKK